MIRTSPTFGVIMFALAIALWTFDTIAFARIMH